ncbi:MAG: hypothetical protein OEQ13_04440, partial [Acidobacteriota bacterium]|nr:hypothetical protein [Acidobacteriota bacterium]
VVSSGAEIRADATEAGDGGRVIVWADEVTVFHGEISARGGEQSGDGGFAEVSGKERLVYRGLADLRAPAGATGTLLLDPENLTILSGDGAPSGGSLDDLLEPQDGVIGAADGDVDDSLTELALEAQSEVSNLDLQANGNFTIEDLADDSLDLTHAITITADFDEDGEGAFSMAAGDAIVTQGATVTIGGAGLEVGSVDTSGANGETGSDAGGILLRALATGNVIVHGDLTARGGRGDGGGDGDATGGDGGFVTVFTRDGFADISGAIDTSGGDGSEGGGRAGDITLLTSGTAPVGTSPELPEGVPLVSGDLTVAGDLIARGGDVPDAPGAAGDGGDGGLVNVVASVGSVQLVSIDTSGGDGADAGGNAGALQIFADGVPATPAPVDDEGDPIGTGTAPVLGDLSVQTITAVGGRGRDGDGGDSGLIDDGLGGAVAFGVQIGTNVGKVTLGSIDASGGASDNGNGGDAAVIDVVSTGSVGIPDVPGSEVSGDVEVTGSLVARGGDSTGPVVLETPLGDSLPTFNGGTGGGVRVSTTTGSIAFTGAAFAVDASGGRGETGGDAGNVTLVTNVSGDITVTAGDLLARGGDAFDSGRVLVDPETLEEFALAFGGGDGGDVGVATLDVGSVAIGSLDASGGGGADDGGDGGSVAIIASMAEEPGSGTVTLAGSLRARGGDGDVAALSVGGVADGEGEAGQDNLVLVSAADAALGDVTLAGEFQLDAVRIGTPDPDPDEPLAVVAPLVVEGDADADVALVLTASGDVAIDLRTPFVAKIDLIQNEAAGNVDITRSNTDPIVAITGRAADLIEEVPQDGGDPVVVGVTKNGASIVEEINTTGQNVLEFVYRLEDSVRVALDGSSQAFPAAIEIETGSMTLGARTQMTSLGDILLGVAPPGGAPAGTPAIAVEGDFPLVLTADSDGDGVGAIRGLALDTHITTVGDVTLEGAMIGAEGAQVPPEPAPLVIEGDGQAAGDLVLAAGGRIDVAVAVRGFDTLSVTQGDVTGDVDVTQSGGDAIDVDGGDGASRVNEITTTEGVRVVYRLADPGDPELVVPVGSTVLGADASLSSTGDLVLGAAGDVAGVAIAMAAGTDLWLRADADLDNSGTIRDGFAGEAAASIDGGVGNGLALVATEGIGAAGDPIVTTGIGNVAGATNLGGFYLDANVGTLRIAQVPEPVDPPVGGLEEPSVGITAGQDVTLRNSGGSIAFAADFDGAHVTSGGDQRYEATAIVLEGDTALVSDGGVDFGSGIDPDVDVEASLDVSADGTIRFGGAIGTDRPLASLTTSGSGVAVLEAGAVNTTGTQDFGTGVDLPVDTVFHATGVNAGGEEVNGQIRFGGTLDGPGGAKIRTPGKVSFGGSIGSGTRLAELAVHDDRIDAADIEFTSGSVVRVGSGGIRLNPMGRTTIPDVATIYNGAGSLSFDTDAAFEVGHREKISVAGDLRITAERVRVGDVNALSLAVNASDVAIRPRAPGPVLLANGTTVTDDGTAVLANTMVFSITPEIDEEFTSDDNGVVTLASQSGEVRTPGPRLTAFEVRLIDDGGTGLGAADFVNAEGVVLDFTATGPAAVDDPVTAIPRRQPTVTELTRPRFGIDQPVAASTRPTFDAVLAFLDCADVGGAATPACLAPAAGGGGQPLADFAPSLATPRARNATLLYRRLVGPGEASRQLRAAFDRAVDDYRRTHGSGAIDGAAFYRYLESSPGQAAALQSVDQLATLFVELQLLDIEPAALQQLRETVARQFLEPAQPGGLGAAALLDAVDASRIGAPGSA